MCHQTERVAHRPDRDGAEVDVSQLLDEARARITPSLREAVDRLAPPMNTVAAYHFGWADVDGNPVDGDSGKALRPALALLSAEIAGAGPAIGVPGGVAVELVHNFSLVHDDLMDRDEQRRHRSTVWSAFGEDHAVLAGDALFSLALEVLVDANLDGRIAPADVARATRRIITGARRLIDGQAQDLALERRTRLDVGECLEMEGNKTGALMGVSSSIGAVLAGIGDGAADALERYGYHVGLAFQAVDDILGIWGAPDVTGKPRWSDLRRGKKSLPVTAALVSGTAAARRLAELLDHTSRSDEAAGVRLTECAALIVEAGGKAWAHQEARRQHRAALSALDVVEMPAAVHRKFTALADFVLAREI